MDVQHEVAGKRRLTAISRGAVDSKPYSDATAAIRLALPNTILVVTAACPRRL